MSSLFERIGGSAAVNAAVDIFYDKVLADDRISHFFDNLDMVAQANKQKNRHSWHLCNPNGCHQQKILWLQHRSQRASLSCFDHRNHR